MSGEYFNFFGRQDVQIKKTHLQGALKTYSDYETGLTGAVLWPLSVLGSLSKRRRPATHSQIKKRAIQFPLQK